MYNYFDSEVVEILKTFFKFYNKTKSDINHSLVILNDLYQSPSTEEKVEVKIFQMLSPRYIVI